MKCPICKGKTVEQIITDGMVDTVTCKHCDGTGIVRFRRISAICGKCKGIGYIDEPQKKAEQTNEEMLRGCTFEELAGAIYEWYTQGHIEGKRGKNLSSVTRVVEWLKQPHTTEE